MTFAVLSGFCGLAWIFVYYLCPETKGKPIEQIVEEICPHTKNMHHHEDHVMLADADAAKETH